MKFFNYNKLFFLFFFPSLLLCASRYPCDKLYYSSVSLKHREHRGIGFNQGYSTFGLFVAPPKPHSFTPFFDARLHTFNSGYLASNLGLGIRLTNPARSVIVGAHAYYDFRNYKSFSSHQGSLGIELLTKWIDIRGSVNAPFSGLFKEYDRKFHKFSGNYSYFKKTLRYALPMAEAEIGVTLPAPLSDVGLYLALGGYYLFKQNGYDTQTKSAAGGKVRLVASPQPYISFDVTYSKDQLFGSRTNGSICFNVPLGKTKIQSKKRSYSKYDSSCAYMKGISARYAQVPFHQEIIPFYSENSIFKHSSKDNNPYKFIFVNNKNLSPSGIGSGSGSFEDPYTTLKLAEQNSSSKEVIYVFYGTGNDDGYNKGFIFKDNQILQGSGTPLTLGDHTYAPFTPGENPLISNTESPGTAPIIASSVLNPFVQGFRVASILSDTASISNTNFYAASNTFTPDVTYYSINHVGPQGNSVLTNNLFNNQGPIVLGGLSNSSYLVSNNTFNSTNQQNGLSVTNSNSDFSIIGNSFSSNSNITGIAISFSQLNCDVFSASIENNMITSGFEYAVNIQDESSTAAVIIDQNAFTSDFKDAAIDIQSYSYSSNYQITNNILSSPTASVITIGYIAITIPPSSSYFSKNQLSISTNTINYNGAYQGIGISSTANAQLEAQIVDNQFHLTSAGSIGKGISVSQNSKEPSCVDIFNNSGVYGLTLTKSSAGTLQLDAIGSNLTGLLSQNNNIALANCIITGSPFYVPPGSPCPPFQAIFVNNTANPALGNGSFVYPYANLAAGVAASSPGDMIYVFTGNGTSSGYNQSISLKENQLLVGSSTPFAYKGITIDPLTTGAKPKLSFSSTGSGSTITTPCSTRIIGLDVSSNNAAETILVSSPTPGSASMQINSCDFSSVLSSYCLNVNSNNPFKTFNASECTFSADGVPAIYSNCSSLTFNLSDSQVTCVSPAASTPAVWINIQDEGTVNVSNNTITHPNECVKIQDAIIETIATISVSGNTLTSLASTALDCEITQGLSYAVVSTSNNKIKGLTNDASFKFGNTPSRLSLSQNTLTNSLKVYAQDVCFPTFSGNTALGYSFNGNTGVNSNYTFQAGYFNIINENTGAISFTPAPGYTITPVYGTPCP